MTHHCAPTVRDTRIAAITELRDAGKTKPEIAAALGMSVNALHGFAYRQKIHGLSSASVRTGGWYALTKDQKRAEVRKRHDQGKDLPSIAADLDIPMSALSQFCRRHSGPVLATDQRVVVKHAPPMTLDTRPIRPDAWTPIAEPVAFMANIGCDWPVDGGCCGQPKGRRRDGRISSYCAHHHAIAYPGSAPLKESSIDWLADVDRRGARAQEQQWAPPSEKRLAWLEE